MMFGGTIMVNGIAGQLLLVVIGLVVAGIVFVQLFFVLEVWRRGGKGLAAEVLWTMVLLLSGWIGLFAYLMAGRSDTVVAADVKESVEPSRLTTALAFVTSTFAPSAFAQGACCSWPPGACCSLPRRVPAH
jgi:hypothetical protein